MHILKGINILRSVLKSKKLLKDKESHGF